MRPTRVDTSSVLACTKCGRSDVPVYRHHMGNDGQLGWYNRGIRGNYYKYHDCTLLCFDCHCEIHFIYDPYIDRWVNRTPAGARHLRLYLIGVCQDWLAGRIKSPSIPKAYKRQFKRSLKAWEKSRSG